MAMPTLYNCRHSGDRYRISKFDHHFDLESSYLCDADACECPAGHRPSCRHRQMLPKFIARGAINTGWFFDFDRGGWVQGEIEPAPEVVIEELAQQQFLNGLSQTVTHTAIYTSDEPPLPINHVELFVSTNPQEPEPTKHEFRPTPTPTIRRRV